MIKIIGTIPTRVTIACSGGLDSMALLSFLLRTRRKITVVHFNHGTEHGKEAEKFVNEFCTKHNLLCHNGYLMVSKPKGVSTEAFWREERYLFMDTYSPKKDPILLAHHLDDCIENWVFTSLHGKPHTIPYKRGRCIRPLLLTKKAELKRWVERHKIPYIIDPSNTNTRYMRNKIRHDIIPHLLQVNPGLHKVIRRQVLAENQLQTLIK
jgi:tRNA(Ile)-lysidine synthase